MGSGAPISSVKVVEEGEGADLNGTLASSPAEIVSKADQPLSVTPFSGTVPPLGKIPLEFNFSPSVFVERTGFICNGERFDEGKRERNHKYVYAGKVESEDLGLTLPVALTGKALLPALKVSPDMLQFGHCHANERRDIVMRITNRSEVMPLDFEIPRVPHMGISPSKGYLAPKQNISVVVSYMPKALGKFNEDLTIKYCNNLYTHTMRCYGDAPAIGEKKIPVKGLERTGRDFDAEHNFVNQDNLTLAKPKTRNLQSLTKIMKSDLSRNVSSSEALDGIMLDMPEPTPHSLSPSAMQEYVRNKQKYNLHLKQMRIKRKIQEKTGGVPPLPIDIFMEDDVDKGMQAGSGLKSPKYSVDHIPADKLHLQRALDDENGARGVTGHRYVHDENKLVKRKFKAGPTTQAEVRDCSASLENWQLSLISTGPKMLDFGNVYVKSQVSELH